MVAAVVAVLAGLLDNLEPRLLLRDVADELMCELDLMPGTVVELDVEACEWLCCLSVAVSGTLRSLAGERLREAAFACFLCNLLVSISCRRA